VSDEVRGASSAGLSFVREIEVDFPTEPPPARSASSAVTALLVAPFRWGDQQVGQGPQLAANQLAAEFCARQDDRVLGRYPFRSGAQEAALQDVTALLDPAAGQMNAFFDAAEATGATLNDAYESFRSRAREISSAFYRSGAASPGFNILFQVRGFDAIDRVELRVDGQSRVYTPVQQDRERFVWDASRAEQVNLMVQAGERRESLDFNGTWAIFRLFHQGTWQDAGGGNYRVTWSMPSGTRVTADVSMLGAPILDRAYLSTFQCPRRIAR
jgi:type VI protein secretion system component VasK